jgi:hypothetical protein
MRGSTCISASAALLAALTLLVSGCSAPTDKRPQPSSSPVAVNASPSPTPPAAVPPGNPLEASFVELIATLPAGEVGIAVSGGQQSRSFGSWWSGTVWSTIKVPLAIAAIRKNSQAAQPLMAKAIAESDNAAAERLWAMLGSPPEAAQAVQTVLIAGGDSSTSVQSQRVRPQFTAFGQTDWPQQQQARFAYALPCLGAASPVIDQMRHLDAEQQWGLATADDVAEKGGWGPDPDGRYLVRQLAVVTNQSGTSGVALAAKPADGRFETGAAMITRLGVWVLEHRGELPAGRCD